MMRYPKRRDEANNERELPSLQQLSDDDEVFVRSMLALAETGDMVRGRYVEAHIARMIGADFPPVGTSAWDLVVPDDPPIHVEVKSTRDGRFDIEKLFNGDDAVWVFVKLDLESATRACDYQYAVAGPAEREELSGQLGESVAWRKLFRNDHLVVAAEELASEVRRRAGRR